MGFFRSLIAPAARPSAPPPTPVAPKFSFEGLSERDAVSLHSSARIKAYSRDEVAFKGTESRNFLIVAEGAVDVSIQTNRGTNVPSTYITGDCISPFQGAENSPYIIECREATTLIEVTPAAFQLLPDKAQLWIYRRANGALGRAHREVLREGVENERRNGLLTLYIENELAKKRSVVFSEFIQGFIRKTPRLPVFVMELAAKLLDEGTSVQEVVTSIKRDPAMAAAVLRTVNSAMYGFTNKIENFYHACVVLGFDNIYQLVLRDALRQVVPSNAETKIVHSHSCVTSALCYETAMATAGKIHPQTAMTYGLLHEVGCSVIWLIKAEKAVAPEFVPLLDSAKIGSDLLQQWGLPDRICRVIELQRYPEFAPPDAIDPEFRQDLAVLHLAHLFEDMVQGETPDPGKRVHSQAYMRVLGLEGQTPEGFFMSRIAPALSRNKQRYGLEVRQLIDRLEESSKEKA